MRRIGIVLLFGIPGAVFISWLAWFLSPSHSVNLLILDKTVVNQQANEHRALSWLLVHERYVPPTGSFDPGENFVGFWPTGDGNYTITGFETRDSTELLKLAASYDAAYVADTYGIFERTWHEQYPELGPITQPWHRIYGGMHANDLAVLRALKAQNKLLIAEFSVLEPPTPPDIRAGLESLLGLSWTGWTGRYFITLDSTGRDLPDWIVTNFMKQSGGSWPYRDQPGIVLSHVDGHIVILRYPDDLERPTPEVAVTFDHRARFRAPVEPLPYSFWFDIVQPDTGMRTVAYFTLPTKPQADTLLHAFGIPRIFPAVLEETRTLRTYYFAGDFADYPDVYHILAHFKWMRSARLRLYTIDDPADRSEFYWTLYYPMVKSILSSALPAQ